MQEENNAEHTIEFENQPPTENDKPVVRRTGGPRTPAGKRRSRTNAVTHGIFSEVSLSKTESRKFNYLLRGLRDCFNPVGTFEDLLVEEIAVLVWRYRRLLSVDRLTSISWTGGTSLEGLAGLLPPLDLQLRYETTLGRAIDRAVSPLERAQRMRLGQPAPPHIEIDFHHTSPSEFIREKAAL
jgi:hypothetical protein